MHSTIPRRIRLVFEAHLANRAVLLLEGWDDILSAEAVWYQPKLRILCLLWSGIGRIWDDDYAGASELRLGMAHEALIGVMPCVCIVVIGSDLREQRIQFTGNRGAIRHVVAAIAGSLKLASPLNSFFKRCTLIVVDGCAGDGVWADQGRMGDWDSLLL